MERRFDPIAPEEGRCCLEQVKWQGGPMNCRGDLANSAGMRRQPTGILRATPQIRWLPRRIGLTDTDQRILLIWIFQGHLCGMSPVQGT